MPVALREAAKQHDLFSEGKRKKKQGPRHMGMVALPSGAIPPGTQCVSIGRGTARCSNPRAIAY